MKTVTVTGIVHLATYSGNDPYYALFASDMSAYGHALIGPASFEFKMPENFSPNSARINLLEKERERINAEFYKRVDAINIQINKLQAIEYVEEASA